MQVILLERMANLGFIGDVVKVRPGYARNFLLPFRKALRATKANIEHFEQQKAQIEANNLKKRSEAEVVAKKMEGLTVLLIRQASETGHLYGSIRGKDIAEKVELEGFSIDRNQVVLSTPIKVLGLHDVKVALHPEVLCNIKVHIAQSEEEARAAFSSEEEISESAE